MGAGLSQAELGRTLGVSRAAVARWESGRYVATTVVDLARALRLLGHELRFTTYPVGSPLRDAGHLKLINRVLSHVAAPLRYQTDAPLPNPGDMRAWDILLAVDHLRVAIEVETVLRDLQELVRRISTKRRDRGVDASSSCSGTRSETAMPSPSYCVCCPTTRHTRGPILPNARGRRASARCDRADLAGSNLGERAVRSAGAGRGGGWSGAGRSWSAVAPSTGPAHTTCAYRPCSPDRRHAGGHRHPSIRLARLSGTALKALGSRSRAFRPRWTALGPALEHDSAGRKRRYAGRERHIRLNRRYMHTWCARGGSAWCPRTGFVCPHVPPCAPVCPRARPRVRPRAPPARLPTGPPAATAH
jgi:transcriptional regulator with XRE-family HTH domain